GGSVGGLFAAHLLRQAGFEVMGFERATGDLGDRGTGIGTRAELFAVMRRIGIAAHATGEAAVRGRIGVGRDGQGVNPTRVTAVTSAWSRIWRPLRAALPERRYRGGAPLVRVKLDDNCIATWFADGSSAQGDLLVAADGLHSTVRTQLIPELKPSY